MKDSDKYVEFEEVGASEVYVDTDEIVAIHSVSLHLSEHDAGRTATRLVLYGGVTIHVEQSPERVLEMIDQRSEKIYRNLNNKVDPRFSL